MLELRDRLQEFMPDGESGAAPRKAPLQEAIAALETLGYKPREAERCARAACRPGLNSEQIIRAALRRLLRM